MLAALRRIVQSVGSAEHPDEALHVAASQIREVMACECCSIYLSDEHSQHFILQATDGLAPEAVGEASMAFGEGLVGLVAKREEPLNITDAQHHPHFKYLPEVCEETLNAFLGTPLIHQRQLLGVLVVQHDQARVFSEAEEAFLVTLAAQLAGTIAHARASGRLFLANQPPGPASGQSRLAIRPAAPGIAIGQGVLISPQVSFSQVVEQRTEDVDAELTRFNQALVKTRHQMAALGNELAEQLPPEVVALFEMYQHLLDANSLGNAVESEIRQGWGAPTALRRVIAHYVEQFEAMEDPYLRERAADVQDMGVRLLAQLVGAERRHDNFPPDTILVAEELTATMLAEVPGESLRGIISLRGAHNSHAAILARALGIPALIGGEGIIPGQLDRCTLILNGYQGEVLLNPGATVLNEYQAKIARDHHFQAQLEELAALPTITPDGHAIDLLINAGLLPDSLQQTGAAGIGLYRTEIPFMVRDRFPSEEEQYQIYREVLAQAAPQPVTMRTLDIGGDKPLDYFPIDDENPFLGWRGIRLTLDQPEIFLVQLRAMLRASIDLNNLRILLPMLSSAAELDECQRFIEQAWQEVSAELTAEQHLQRPLIGVMLEVPALLWQLDVLARHADFFSVGTNDLVQYLLAVDRNNGRVARLYDSYHPAVLRSLARVASECKQLGIPVSVCGEMAGEPAGALILAAMGYRQLSMSKVSIPRIKWLLRRFPFDVSCALLDQVLAQSDAADVRRLLERQLITQGCGQLLPLQH